MSERETERRRELGEKGKKGKKVPRQRRRLSVTGPIKASRFFGGNVLSKAKSMSRKRCLLSRADSAEFFKEAQQLSACLDEISHVRFVSSKSEENKPPEAQPPEAQPPVALSPVPPPTISHKKQKASEQPAVSGTISSLFQSLHFVLISGGRDLSSARVGLLYDIIQKHGACCFLLQSFPKLKSCSFCRR